MTVKTKEPVAGAPDSGAMHSEKKATEGGAIGKVVRQIKEEQRRIDRSEGSVVASLLSIGRRLLELRGLARKTWARQLEKVGMAPRVASRYLMVGESWLGRIGLKESELLTRLPTDLLKLEWLCRLDRDQLEKLLGDLECKKADRQKVKEAVKRALGEETGPPAPRAGDLAKVIDLHIGRLVKAIERWHEAGRSADSPGALRDALAGGFARVEQALTGTVKLAGASRQERG